MRAVVRTLKNSGGQLAAVDQTFDVERLRIGRGTDQDVELGDMRVALAHAQISIDQPYRIQVRGGATVWINDAPATDGKLDIGDHIDIGRYRLTVLTPELGTDLLLSVQEWVTAREDRAQWQGQQRMRLDQTKLSRRRWAWLAVLLVLLPGLVVPAVLRYAAHAPQPGDRLWLAGPLSRAHAQVGRDCSICHTRPLHRVSNETCAACHAGVHPHTGNRQLAAQTFSRVDCTGCHQEHHGMDGLMPQGQQSCTDCHAQPGAGNAVAELAPVSDFVEHHPPFRASVARVDGHTWVQARAAPGSAQWREETQLRFPHDKHLRAKGIDSPDGTKVLGCADCHRPDAAGHGFQPVTMKAHCASCHRLDFDPAVPARELPHAQPAEVVQIIRDYYGRRALLGGDERPVRAGELRRVPGPDDAPSPAGIAWAERRSRQAIDDVFDRRVCVYCHVVTRNADPQLPWTIAPVAPGMPSYAHARFDHAAHRAERCESCHDARASAHSEDVLLPPIATCRKCHGDPDSSTAVPSSCMSCHAFHMAQGTWLTAPHPGKPP